MSLEDKLYNLLHFYKTLPDWLKTIFVAPFRLLPRTSYLGSFYKEHYLELKSMQSWNRTQIDNFQTEKVIGLINHAYHNVPYYKMRWDELGIDIKQICTLEDFSKFIPFLNKEDIQQNPEDFIARNYSKSRILEMNTGGSTGIPLKLYYTKGETRPAVKAHVQFIYDTFGIKANDRIARLRGDYIGKSVISSYDPYRNVLILSSYELKPNNVLEYLRLLKKYKIHYLYGYPASIENLVKLAIENNIEFNSKEFKGIIFTSENVYKYQEDLCSEYFRTTNILKTYGNTEWTVLAFNCPSYDGYHFIPTHSYVEFIPQALDGNWNGKLVDVVGTSFTNPAFPLIRYQTNDLGELSDSDYTRTKFSFPYLKNIIGRQQEIAVGKDGRQITLTALIFGRHEKYLNNILKMQVINTEPGKLHVLVLPNKNYSEDDTNEIVKTLSRKEGMPFETTVELVNEIAPTNSGKHKFFIRKF